MLDDYLEVYKEWLKNKGLSKSTICAYVICLNHYLQWHKDTYDIESTKILNENVIEYRSFLQDYKKLKASTINSKLAALIKYNEYLAELESNQRVVTAVAKKVYLRNQTAYISPSRLDENDVDQFRQAVFFGSGLLGERNHAIVTIIAYGGLRISETLCLKHDDVDIFNKQITVQEGRGNNKRRIVYIGDKIVSSLKRYIDSKGYIDRPWLFPGRGGKNHLNRSVVNKIFNNFSSEITPDTLRRFYCSNAFEKGYNIHEVANQAGHSDINTTLKYTHLTIENMKEKANRL